jgi:hypothetical protein
MDRTISIGFNKFHVAPRALVSHEDVSGGSVFGSNNAALSPPMQASIDVAVLRYRWSEYNASEILIGG